jgi:hypothetical protein
MTTIMYDDVVHDVEKKGYVCISHVWGDQQLYPASELDVLGVDWMIPLSCPKKLQRVVKAMSYFGKEYCWWDVLCMPQDKQDEINKEIPYMGDYYAGAIMTLVISSTKDRLKFLRTSLETYMTNKISMRGKSGYVWTRTIIDTTNILNDEWLNRVWTLQEAVLSRNMLYVSPSNVYLKLSEALDVLVDKRAEEPMSAKSDQDETASMVKLCNGIRAYRNGRMDLMDVLSMSMERCCKIPQDIFYGVIGILGYTAFPIDYSMDKYALSIEIARYAYSKGDISWLAISKDPSAGFIQLANTPFGHIGTDWKKDVLGTCMIRDKTLEISACVIGSVTQSRHWSRNESKHEFANFALHTLKALEFSIDTAKDVIAVDREVSSSLLESFVCFHGYLSDIPLGSYWTNMKERSHINEYMKLEHMLNREHMNPIKSIAVITHYETGRRQPVIVCGKPDIGDSVMLLRVHDRYGRVLGIIVDQNHRRKGMFLHTKSNMEDGLSYVLHEFPL